MVALGILLLLVGLAYAVPRDSLIGSASARNLGLGMQGLHQTPGDSPQPLGKRKWFKSLVGTVAIIVGGLLIHFGTN